MLAFDDIAFARICIAATAIPHKDRNRFLKDIAARAEGHAPNATALRMRKYRRRLLAGGAFFRVRVDDVVALEEMLRAAGQLAPHADSRAEIETALSKFIAIIGTESRSVSLGGRGNLEAMQPSVYGHAD
jgi:uncharacterized membrane protein